MPWDFWLIFFLLGVVVPWRGRFRLRQLLAKPSVGSAERILLYTSTIAFQWTAAGVVAWRAWAHGLRASQLGLVPHGAWPVLAAATIGAAIFTILQWMNLRRMSRMPEKMRGQLQAIAERILPQSPSERAPFFVLAVTAGVCEEFLYRGFAMTAFTDAGVPLWGAVVLSSILFGLAHLYQGRGGLVGTMSLGLAFGVARVIFGSLIPVVCWHIAVDVVAGIAGPRYLTHKTMVVGQEKL